MAERPLPSALRLLMQPEVRVSNGKIFIVVPNLLRDDNDKYYEIGSLPFYLDVNSVYYKEADDETKKNIAYGWEEMQRFILRAFAAGKDMQRREISGALNGTSQL